MVEVQVHDSKLVKCNLRRTNESNWLGKEGESDSGIRNMYRSPVGSPLLIQFAKYFRIGEIDLSEIVNSTKLQKKKANSECKLSCV